MAVATDNDQFLLRAFDAADTMVAEFDTGQFRNDEMTMNVAWPGGISYILAFGDADNDGGGPLDDLQVEFVNFVPVVMDINPNLINVCDEGDILPEPGAHDHGRW